MTLPVTCPVLVPFLPPLNYLPGKNHIANKTPFTTTKARQGRTGASARFPGGNRGSAGAGRAKRSRMPRRGCHRKVTGVDRHTVSNSF